MERAESSENQPAAAEVPLRSTVGHEKGRNIRKPAGCRRSALKEYCKGMKRAESSENQPVAAKEPLRSTVRA